MSREISTEFERFTQDLSRNATLQSAVAEISKNPNHQGLVNVAKTFGYNVTLEDVTNYKRGLDNVVKNAQYLGSLLG